MKKINLNLLTLLTVFLTTSIFMACSNDDVSIEPDTQNIEKLLLNKYDINKIDNSNIDLTKINFTSNNHKMSDAVIYELNSLNEQIAILPNLTNLNKFTVLKGSIFGNKNSSLKELEVTFNLDKEKNGSVEFLNVKNGGAFVLIYEKGLPTSDNVVSSETSDLSARRLCQQVGGEGFKGCFKRESDEFQDDFFSTVAYITNPQIALLIAALCSC